MRSENDFYRTPEWCTQAVLKTLNGWTPTFDPCAGDGAILAVCFTATGIELHQEIPEYMQGRIGRGDGLAASWEGHNVIINPPFSDILAWMRKAQEADSALILMRTGVLGGQKRQAFWEVHRPSVIRYLSRRPSFTSDGKTDMYDYAWVGWNIDAEPVGWIS